MRASFASRPQFERLWLFAGIPQREFGRGRTHPFWHFASDILAISCCDRARGLPIFRFRLPPRPSKPLVCRCLAAQCRQGAIGLPHDQRRRSTHARSPPRRGCNQPYSGVVVPLMPTQCAVCRTRAIVTDQHRGRARRETQTAGAWRVTVNYCAVRKSDR